MLQVCRSLKGGARRLIPRPLVWSGNEPGLDMVPTMSVKIAGWGHRSVRKLAVGYNYESSATNIVHQFPEKIRPYLRLIRLDRPIGTWLVYWPSTWGIAMATNAGHFPDIKLLLLFGAGSFVMRGAGCTINDLWDRDIDKKVFRTRDRPLASGAISPLQAVVFLSAQLSVGLTILLSLNTYSIILAACSLPLVVLYPLMKRITFWPQITLGLTINWGSLVGYSAACGYCDWSVCLPLYAAAAMWSLHYDTIYAYQDVDDDSKVGVRSTALLFGPRPKPWLAGFATGMTTLLLLAGLNAGQAWPYFVGVGVCASHLAWQIALLSLSDRKDSLRKFRSNTHVGVIVFLAIVAGSLLKPQPKKTHAHTIEQL